MGSTSTMTDLNEIIENGKKYNEKFTEPQPSLIHAIYEDILKFLYPHREKFVISGNIIFNAEQYDETALILYLQKNNTPLEIYYQNDDIEIVMTSLAKYLFEKKYRFILARQSYIKKIYELEVEFVNLLKMYKIPGYYKFVKNLQGKFYYNGNLNINLEFMYFYNIFPKMYSSTWEENVKNEQWFYENMITLSTDHVPMLKGFDMEPILKDLQKKNIYYQLTGITQYNFLKGHPTNNGILHVITNEENLPYFTNKFPTQEYNHLTFDTPAYFQKMIIIQKGREPNMIILLNSYPITTIEQDKLAFTNFHGMLLSLYILNHIHSDNRIELVIQDIIRARIQYLKANDQPGLENNLWNVFGTTTASLQHPYMTFKEIEWKGELGDSAFFYKPEIEAEKAKEKEKKDEKKDEKDIDST